MVLRNCLLAGLLCVASWVTAAEPLPSKTNGLGMKLVQIPAGEFQRGMTDDFVLRLNHPNTLEQGADLTDERPAHPVRLTKPFWLATHEVTVRQFREFVETTKYETSAEKSGRGGLAFNPAEKEGVNRFELRADCTWRNPGFAQTDEHPVTCVSWRDAVAFCEWLGKREGVRYRLPSEAEWEYAARAGGDTIYVGGNAPATVYAFGNIGDSALEAAHPGTVKRQHLTLTPAESLDGEIYTSPVRKFQPNAWGLFDTHGNVWEWCSDRYYDRYYQDIVKAVRDRRSGKLAATVDPQGPETTPQHKYGDWRSMRGGCWYTGPMASRCASRAYGEADDAFCYTGFRVVQESP
ncbi:MAG: formylglycine-generating enzyme family protein [Planctomycetaceae bacterium]|nr:formylglycine-generating enzyme family protein [Planctomycetaceae bacterium]